MLALLLDFITTNDADDDEDGDEGVEVEVEYPEGCTFADYDQDHFNIRGNQNLWDGESGS